MNAYKKIYNSKSQIKNSPPVNSKVQKVYRRRPRLHSVVLDPKSPFKWTRLTFQTPIYTRLLRELKEKRALERKLGEISDQVMELSLNEYVEN